MTDSLPPSHDPFSKPARARMARVMAVQAIYQSRMTETPIHQVLEQFTETELTGTKGRKTDKKLFAGILTFLHQYPDQIFPTLEAQLSPRYRLDRLETVLQAILISSCCEARLAQTPPAILISEYLQVTRGFFDREEPKLVNWVLDNVVKKLS